MRILPAALKTEVEGLIEKKTITLDLWDELLVNDDDDNYYIGVVMLKPDADNHDRVVMLMIIVEGITML